MSSARATSTSRVQKDPENSCKESRRKMFVYTVDSLDSKKMKSLTVLSLEHSDPDYLKSEELTKSYNLSPIYAKESMESESALGLTLKGLCYEKGTKGSDNYPKAVEYYTRSADKGEPLGLFRLALMTQEGKGVPKDPKEGFSLLLQAANKDPLFTYAKGSKCRNPGVAEACHALGNSFFFEIGVGYDFDKAFHYYQKALRLGFVLSSYSIGLLLHSTSKSEDDEVFKKGILYLELSAHLGVICGMETLAETFVDLRKFTLAQKWYHFALHNGSIAFQAKEKANKYLRDLSLDLTFKPEEFASQLEKDVKISNVVGPLLTEIEKLRGEIAKMEGWFLSKSVGRFARKRELIKRHRQEFGRAQELRRQGITGNPLEMPESHEAVDAVGLSQIYFKGFDSMSNRTFKGCVLKVTVIEDVVEWAGTLRLLVQDSYGDVGRLIVSNYLQKGVKTVQEELGFGCRLSVLCPRVETSTSSDVCVYVENPVEFLLRHWTLRNAHRCRCCGQEDGNTVECEKCGRVAYCSQKCLKTDADDFSHSSVCFKDIQ